MIRLDLNCALQEFSLRIKILSVLVYDVWGKFLRVQKSFRICALP